MIEITNLEICSGCIIRIKPSEINNINVFSWKCPCYFKVSKKYIHVLCKQKNDTIVLTSPMDQLTSHNCHQCRACQLHCHQESDKHLYSPSYQLAASNQEFYHILDMRIRYLFFYERLQTQNRSGSEKRR